MRTCLRLRRKKKRGQSVGPTRKPRQLELGKEVRKRREGEKKAPSVGAKGGGSKMLLLRKGIIFMHIPILAFKDTEETAPGRSVLEGKRSSCSKRRKRSP